jgi:tetratricopeptide (TPR) repeat protein
MFQATIQEADGKAIFDKFKIRATPTVMMLEPDGSELDWIVGYDPPAEDYQAGVDKAFKGIDTYKSLAAQNAKNPQDIAVLFKLAQKWDDRYDQEKAADLYKQVLALDPNGTKGTTEYGRNKEKVSYTEYAEFNIGESAMSKRPPDPAPLRAFVKKYPDGTIVKDAYTRMSSYYGRQAAKDDATKFFEEYTGRFPQEGSAYLGWANRVLFDKEPVDKGVALAQKAVELAQGRAVTISYQTLGRLYLLKGDKEKSVETADQLLKVAQTPPAKPGEIPATPINPAMLATPMAAQIYADAGRSDKALAVYGPEFLKTNMENSGILGRYAQFWAAQGQNLDSALAAAKKVTELAPDSFNSYTALSTVYQKLKNYDEALKAAEKALSIAPAQPPQIKERIQKTIDSIKASGAEKK